MDEVSKRDENEKLEEMLRTSARALAVVGLEMREVALKYLSLFVGSFNMICDHLKSGFSSYLKDVVFKSWGYTEAQRFS